MNTFTTTSGRLSMAAAVLALTMAIGHAHAAAPVIYPAKGQSVSQQDQDKYQCHGWAQQQSGFDPLQPAPTTSATTGTATQQPGATQAAAGGFVKGAAVGAAVGELAHNDAGRGAAAGALGGVVLQGVKQRQAAQAQQQQQQQQAAQQQAARNQQKATFDRAFGACMEARGYVVK